MLFPQNAEQSAALETMVLGGKNEGRCPRCATTTRAATNLDKLELDTISS